MSKLLFYILIKPISYLPYRILYAISDILFIIIFYIIPYRKKVVINNLFNAFPKKSSQEINQLARNFYCHLCDLVVESIKLFSISEAEAIKRFRFLNPELLQKYYDQGKDVILVGGHYNNWELLAVAINNLVPHQCVGIYTPLSNPFFEKKMKLSRSKYGLKMITKREVPSFFAEKHNEPQATIFGADQSPTYSKKVYWTTFLNQDTAVALGTERFSKKYDLPVIYCSINKDKRGFYSSKFTLITDTPKTTNDGEITQMHTSALEKQIIQKPEFWLWTHKRWKRKR